MNTDLKQNEICLTSSPIFTGGLTDPTKKAVSLPPVPSLEEMLDRIGPLPKTALFLGQAEDEEPVLLDLSNPRPGPILITGEARAGKTRLLQVMAGYAVSTHLPREIQYGVVTSCPDEWIDLADASHCVGLFPVDDQSTAEFIHALALWARMQKTRRQYFLLMIDGLDRLTNLNRSVRDELHTLLREGPANGIWPIATLNTNRVAADWLAHFRTRVYAYSGPSETLSKRTEFSLKERTPQIKFRIPRI